MPDAITIAAKADAGDGEIPNISKWIRDACRQRLRRQGIKLAG